MNKRPKCNNRIRQTRSKKKKILIQHDWECLPVSVSGHIPRQPLRQVGSDTVEFLRGWQGVECQLLHVGLHQPVLQSSERKEERQTQERFGISVTSPTLWNFSIPLTLAGMCSKNKRRQTMQSWKGRSNYEDGPRPVEALECNNMMKPRGLTVWFYSLALIYHI